ncbi:nucleotidyltransferase family protein [Pelomonas sp. KK5]|uniref:nucleotidyltransferase domain-containing protein n=1 Tax=Pelomonas sp. KK5 TaxID=1855730 RepID=UPI001180442B|nr:nucleotidyltransferase family protein [Pelomonas sp. KK5]
MSRAPLLVQVLLAPALSERLSLSQWDLLIRQARRAQLLARLALALEGHGAPPQVRPHLETALLLARRQQEATEREILHLRRALRDMPVVLLKGAAYLAAGLGCAEGRTFADVDILVPHARLAEAERALMIQGWAYGELDAYDSRYYRQWMHELPPLTHSRRGSALDVHHTILPPTARIKLDTGLLFERLQPLAGAAPGLGRLFVLAPTDMLLHAATHLFHEGEFDNALRDLFDLDALLREFAATVPGFWTLLLKRAERIGLQRPLHHALRYARRLLGTPVPAAVLAMLRRQPQAAPPRPVQALLDACYHRALRPRHASCELPGSGAALAALYLRSHWLRMPPLLLLQHLGRKQLKRWRGAGETVPAAGT